MDKPPIITTDSTPVASLNSSLPSYIRTEYNAKAEKAKTGCINDFCPAYWRYAGVACLGCVRKYEQIDYWGWGTTKVIKDIN
ncbi:hypothetical protein COY13_04105 [Candidatus Roizmanbacteria bacterium CG_4_10_14_0_2_um_filter_36_35]|uniref:Uncharacterized protein n=4 Tax=Candidatus Roizmaniibacteriota TaxID=1752723 RepID=A0A2M7BVN8_9BACT|nr:MAG: hypothetical protein COV86_01750 [Candidatus Roizmanbacteria bacterium CG11_big_fil_rev_8_21_14_0_20_35_14]PIV10646.1 MAG: hypothetical protein COS50_04315 [Candidatus Roizmanbacteria bacterium CG03_land_8_20_14_0_80_35_26]PIZ67099.1 MAG: hypothetical protein COY13_04105 [Candidatus Roizmanbacteria bacterium CG_4_10_14_0_2_um_filter_36_35]PJC32715.1 MAG: hypothetical protein CO049_02165 [Candidatus Roizmanbacteria bacterium CG_4_9_14_0_2_um_filter_36_12]PJC81057.1 MAG: hypothetical prot